jgi:hypothetical protein
LLMQGFGAHRMRRLYIEIFMTLLFVTNS